MRLIDADSLVSSLNNGRLKEQTGRAVPFNAGVAFALTMVEYAPTIDAMPKWIPCEEKLPDDGRDVLISYRYKEGEGDTSHVYIDITSYGRIWVNSKGVEHKDWRAPFEYFYSNYEVIAWMPLPDPYKGERKDDETGRR